MKKHYVYELINTLGTIEYVGRTTNPNWRMYQHTKAKPSTGTGVGMFYGRNDLHMHIVKDFTNITDANLYEGELKLSYGMEWVERERSRKAACKVGKKWGAINGKKLGKPILVYKKDGSFVGEYPSQNEFSKLYNLHQASVNRVVLGKQKTTGGFIIKSK